MIIVFIQLIIYNYIEKTILSCMFLFPKYTIMVKLRNRYFRR